MRRERVPARASPQVRSYPEPLHGLNAPRAVEVEHQEAITPASHYPPRGGVELVLAQAKTRSIVGGSVW